MTLLEIKNFVADMIGTGDGTTAVPKRDRLINRARAKYYSERRWSYLFKSATLNFTDQVADLDSDADDYNYKWAPQAVYAYSGTHKYHYSQVPWDDFERYNTGSYVYAIDKGSKELKISQTDSTVTMDYYYLPADKAVDTTDNTDVEPAPDITPIGILALSMWYLGSRQARGTYQLFKDEYRTELLLAIANDPKPIRRFNKPTRTNEGYKS